MTKPEAGTCAICGLSGGMHRPADHLVPATPQRAGDGFRNCEFCGCHTNAKMRSCCEDGRDADKYASQQAGDAPGKCEHGVPDMNICDVCDQRSEAASATREDAGTAEGSLAVPTSAAFRAPAPDHPQPAAADQLYGQAKSSKLTGSHAPEAADLVARPKLFKTTVLGVGPFCIEFPDGEIVYMRSEKRQKAIAEAAAAIESQAAQAENDELVITTIYRQRNAANVRADKAEAEAAAESREVTAWRTRTNLAEAEVARLTRELNSSYDRGARLAQWMKDAEDRTVLYQELLWRVYEGVYGHRQAEGIDPFETAVRGACAIAKQRRETEARADALAGALREHNKSCEERCGLGDQEGVACGYRPYFPRRCPNCPKHEMIEIPGEK